MIVMAYEHSITVYELRFKRDGAFLSLHMYSAVSLRYFTSSCSRIASPEVRSTHRYGSKSTNQYSTMTMSQWLHISMLIILVYCGGYADDKHRVVVVNAAAYADDFTDPLNGSRTEYDQELQLNETSTYSGFLLILSTGCLMKSDMKNYVQRPRRPSKRLGKGPSLVTLTWVKTSASGPRVHRVGESDVDGRTMTV